jgi:hypothetical protein
LCKILWNTFLALGWFGVVVGLYASLQLFLAGYSIIIPYGSVAVLQIVGFLALLVGIVDKAICSNVPFPIVDSPEC